MRTNIESVIQTSHPTSLPQGEWLQRISQLSFEHNFQIACWRLPKSHETNVLLDLTGTIKHRKVDLEELKSGFVFSPYQQDETKEAIYLQSDIYFTLGKGEKESPEPNLQGYKAQEVWEAVLQTKLKTKTSQSYYTADNTLDIKSTTPESFKQTVSKAVQAIQAGEFYKVVPARTKRIPLSESFNLVKAYLTLCEKYPNAFVSLVSLPGIGTWLGASPEVLIRVDKDDYFHTMALAGTQVVQGENPLKEVAWTQKEIEEQALVSRYIINCFKQIRLREYEEVGPKTIIAGHLMHLRTDYRVNMKATNFPQLGTVMLSLLHPTSAICGMPKQPAMDFLAAHESFSRSFFSGFLGPVNIQEETQLFVNLRCAQLLDEEAVLYAGAGVTEDSDPEKEWIETEMKCKIMQAVLNPTSI